MAPSRQRSGSRSARRGRRALIVAGMHRSGTSAVARMLMLLGADGPRNVMPPREGNESGHWEPELIVDLNDELLDSADSSWDDVTKFPPSWFGSAAADRFRADAAELVESEYEGSELFVLKDPRICRLIPFWATVLDDLGIEPSFVIPVRNPLEVAASLKARDGMSSSRALLLWLRNSLDVEQATRGERRALLSFAAMLGDWEGAARELGERLDLSWQRLGHKGKLDVERFLSEAQRHHAFSYEQLAARPEVVDWVKRAYAELGSAADAGIEPDARALGRVRSQLDTAELAFGPVLAEAELEARGGDAHEARDRLEIEVEQLKRKIAVQEDSLVRRAGQVERASAKLKRLTEELSERTEQVKTGEQDRIRVHEDLRTLTEELSERTEQVKTGEQDRIRVHEDLRTLTDRIAAQEAARVETEEALQEVSAVLESRSDELAAAREALSEQDSVRVAAEAEIRRLSDELAAAREALSEQESVRVAAEAEIRRLSDELTAAREALSEQESVRVAAEAEIRRLSGELTTTRSELTTTRSELTTARSELTTARSELTVERQSRAAKEHEAERLSADLAAQALEHERQRGELELAVQRREQAEDEFRARFESLQAQVEELTGALTAIQEAARRGPVRRALARVNAARRSASQMASWVLRHPSRERLRYIPTYFALKRSGAFDADFYLSHSPDVASSGQNPLMHYIEHGAREGRDPNPHFRTREHLIRHPRLLEAGMNPLLHEIKYVGRAPALPSEEETGDGAAAVIGGDSESGRSRRALGKARRRLVSAAVPEGATVLVPGDGTELGEPAGVTVRPLPWPADAEGGWEPASDTGALAQLASLRAAGASHLLLPHEALERIPRYPRLSRFLDRHSAIVAGDDAGAVFDIRPRADGAVPWSGRFEELVEEHHALFGSPPDVLDWGTELGLASRFGELTVIEPVAESGSLPYLADSVGVVVLAGGAGEATLAEARRVARNAVIRVSRNGGGPRLSVDWLRAGEERPLAVSVVIPSYDAAELLEPCLAALAETVPAHVHAELIVVDDASTDSTPRLLARWAEYDDRVRAVRNEENLGFVESCNRGAAEAGGDVLVFLNNDTIALHGWLHPLVRVLVERDDAGAAGGMLVYPDGTLQEAGGVVFSDGTGANFGKHDPQPDRPVYRFLREVDYCSGALLATRRELFTELGGFDGLYRPGYYEDTDYCFRARAAGLRTYYQPESVIVHVEGATSGTDSSPTGPKRHQQLNRAKFERRWAEVLSSHPAPPAEFDESVWSRLARHRPVAGRPAA